MSKSPNKPKKSIVERSKRIENYSVCLVCKGFGTVIDRKTFKDIPCPRCSHNINKKEDNKQ